ncbi:4-hydroxybutyrate dehydrogenase [Pectinatus haikarae]|uniref:4-hydroxybutyrate dehydrogenase n=1 Tax=Pectinatus haikarae TaxID=349096 RepID=A0ABT9Y6Z3_9FIRM|nr:4-hydroxybutyrate dehydrogenase [Pectinatus haikarae]MDQ0203600.1 4-hydroxybutyrate dehydrogenase [Pectinatus haikarae]
MNNFFIRPKITVCTSAEEFCLSYNIGSGDLVFVSEGTRRRNFANAFAGALVVDYRKYVVGEPTDIMIEDISRIIGSQKISRIFAIGGGTILDAAKLFALKQNIPVDKLFNGEILPQKDKKLFLIPTTCGTGSEVTDISILELTKNKTKLGLANEALFADEAILIPELLQNLPYKFFAASSMDALIHAVESYTSPKATEFTRIFSAAAIEKIISGYKLITSEGKKVIPSLLRDFLTASTYAGIAFGNAGCAAVHALSYPLGAARHVPHGEANYAFFIEVYKTYASIRQDGSFELLKQFLAKLLACTPNNVLAELETLLENIIQRKTLHEYGVIEEELPRYTGIVMEKQGRLMSNNYVPLNRDKVLGIYQKLF